jgi:hypothetical protein
VATPDPIPNSAVKHFSTDDILALRKEKVGRRQNNALFYLLVYAKMDTVN